MLLFLVCENNPSIFAANHTGYASSKPRTSDFGNAFATALETLPSQQPISKNFSPGCKSNILMSLSISLFLVGTHGAIDFQAIATGRSTTSIKIENMYCMKNIKEIVCIYTINNLLKVKKYPY